MRWIIGITGLLIVAGSVSAGENWPCFRGPTHDGQSDSTGLPTEWSETNNIAWKAEIHGRAWSSPVVWGNQVWIQTAPPDGKEMWLLCLDRETGKILRDDKLFDVEKPQEIHVTNTHASSTPVIEAGRIYAHFGAYGTACVETDTGKVLWKRSDLSCNHWRGAGSSPVRFGNLLIMHFDGYDQQYAIALNKDTGDTVWKKPRDYDFGTDDGDQKKAYCTPLIIEAAGKTQLISTAAKAILSLNPLTGDEYWRIQFKNHSGTGMPLWGHGRLYLNTGFGKADLLAVKPDGKDDVSKSHVIWTSSKSIGAKPSQILVDDLIFNVEDKGIASCIDAETGKEVWSKRLAGEFSSSIAYGDGKLYFCNHDGSTWVLAPAREYRELAVNKLDKGFRATPAIAGKSLFLRSEMHLYRIETK